jgi:hypothetical protein
MKKRIQMFLLVGVVAVILSGCATIKQPIGQLNVQVTDMRPPVCYHALPLESFFRIKDIVAVEIKLPADWIARQGFSKIGSQVIRRTTFPAAIGGQWGWFIGDKGSPLMGLVLIPEATPKKLTPSDIYLLTEAADVYLKIGQEKIDWRNPIDFSPRNEIGRKNITTLLSGFSATEDGTVATDLNEGNFVDARKASNFFRRFGGAMPTISSALIVPVTWPFYVFNWGLNGVMTEVSLGGSWTASVEDIWAYLKNIPENSEKTLILEALERSRKEKS